MINRLKHILMDPFIMFLFMMLIAWGCYYAGNEPAFNVVAVIAFLWLVIISTPFVPNVLLKRLETQFRPQAKDSISCLKEPVETLVLGGGHINDRSLPSVSRLSNTSLSRLMEAIRIHRETGKGKVVPSGSHSGGLTTQADMLSRAAAELGIEEQYLVKHGDPVTTREEMNEYCQRHNRLEEDNEMRPKTLIIVTSASHMPRAMKMARHLLPDEIDVIASPADFRIKFDKDKNFGLSNFIPALENIIHMKIAMKEYAGLASFHLFLK